MADPLFDLELDLHGSAVRSRDHFLDQGEMVVLQALTDERAGDRESEDVVDEAGRPNVGEPHHEGRVGELFSRAREHPRPRFECRMLRVGRHHAYSTEPFHNGGKPYGGALRQRGGGPVSRPGGKAGWKIARWFSTPHARRGVLTFFLLSRGLASEDARPVYSPLDRRSRSLIERGSSTDGQRQANVSAEQPSPREGARIPAPDADPGRARDPCRASPQRANAGHRLTCADGPGAIARCAARLRRRPAGS